MVKNEVKRRNLDALAKYRDELRIHPRLTYLFLELTNQCNMKCRHCGSGCSPENRENIDLNRVKKVLKEVKERYGSSSVMICVTGGEPLLYPDFREMVKLIDQMGFPWGITTNGVLIDEKMADFLMENHMGSISISLDGLRESHEAFRRTPGSYERALRAVEILQGKGMKVQMTTVVNHSNINELDELYGVLKEMGVYSWRLINIEPIGRALKSPELMLNTEEYRFLLDYIKGKRFDPNVKMEVTYGCSHYLPEEYEHMVRDAYFICGAGINVASIMCNGDIFSCLDIERRPELIQGNIFKDDFCDVWENGFTAFRKDRTQGCEMCRGCEERNFCAGDSTHTWNFEKNEPMLCLYNKLKGEK